jgi:hypothetical protein
MHHGKIVFVDLNTPIVIVEEARSSILSCKVRYLLVLDVKLGSIFFSWWDLKCIC